VTRTEILSRYRHLRAITNYHQEAILSFVSDTTLLEHAKRLGLVVDRTIVTGSDSEMALVYDLAFHTAREGRSSAVERYLRATPQQPGSDDALVLEALHHARFSLWKVERRHDAAGLVVVDMLRDRQEWLMDENLTATVSDGAVFAARVLEPEDFLMSTGVIVPMSTDLVERVLHGSRAWRHGSYEQAAADPRFATAVYRAAIASDTMARVVYAPVGSVKDTKG
jgi:hypothetical protein